MPAALFVFSRREIALFLVEVNIIIIPVKIIEKMIVENTRSTQTENKLSFFMCFSHYEAPLSLLYLVDANKLLIVTKKSINLQNISSSIIDEELLLYQ